jgi:hypothetical protein
VNDFDMAALFHALDAQRRARGLSWQQATDEINSPFRHVPSRPIAVSTVKGMLNKVAVEGNVMLQVLLWLDRTPESFVPGMEQSGQPLPKLPPGRILRWYPPAIYAALQHKRTQLGLTWHQVAEEVGATQVQLTGLAKARHVGFPHVMRLVQWIGLPATDFMFAARR